jgi:tRNA A-37 threonylcarbamoyl transferase component Bud32
MTSLSLPPSIESAVKMMIHNEFQILAFSQLESRRNLVYLIKGSSPLSKTPQQIVAKLYNQPGIAHESHVLREVKNHQIPVPTVLGTTAEVMLLEYIDGENLCDLITIDPKTVYGDLLAKWFFQYHTAFQREADLVLVKGDARIRNFVCVQSTLFGVDFEESYIGSFTWDLADVCASILDTHPIFTEEKLSLCHHFLSTYMGYQEDRDLDDYMQKITLHTIETLQQVLKRRGYPSELKKAISLFKSGKLSF